MDHNSYHSQLQYQDDGCEIMEKENYSNYEEDFSEEYEVEGDALLISLVREHPYLYNKELNDFKDSIKKQNAWVEIGTILNMTMEECQTKWLRLRERYTREKKQREQETTTGSGASKRKSFEFFKNMQFLERFVKRRRTTTNIKSAPPLRKYSSLQKNFGLHRGKEMSPAIVTTFKHILSKSPNTVQNLRNFDLCSEKEINTYSNMDINASNTNTLNIARNQRNFEPLGERGINRDNMDNNMNKSSVAQNLRNFDLYGEKDINADNMDININSTELSSSAQYAKNKSNHSDIHETSSIPESNITDPSDNTRNRGLTRSKIKPKGKQTDILQNTICKVSSLLENRFPASSSSSLSLKPEIDEDVALCQLILTSLKNMPLNTKTDKKKELLRIIYDI